MRGQQTYPLTIHVNMWTVSSDVSIQRRQWQPPSVHLWAYCTHPTHDVNDVMCEGWPQHRGSTSATLFEQWCGFFYVPQEPAKCWSGRGSNSRPPAQHTGALPTDPTRRRFLLYLSTVCSDIVMSYDPNYKLTFCKRNMIGTPVKRSVGLAFSVRPLQRPKYN